MHRSVVINDTDIISRRDNQQKPARKRKVAQRGYGEKSGWGNARMYVPKTIAPHRLLHVTPGGYVHTLGPVDSGVAAAAMTPRAIATATVDAPWIVRLLDFPWFPRY